MGLLRRKKTRVLVVGLDGVPFSLLNDLMQRGVMPRMKEITAQGALAPMTVTLPEISSVSWSTFMTGTDPGTHGIFGFTDLSEDYRTRFPCFRDLACPTIWDRLGERGRKCLVVNQPSTYPARPIDGILVSGFVAVELERSLFPARYLGRLRRMNYRIDADTKRCADDPDLLFGSLGELLAGRQRLLDEFWAEEDWSFIEVVVTGTDRLHHFQWWAYEDENNPNHDRFFSYYEKVDGFVGRVVDRFAAAWPEGRVFLLSDHGFCGARNEVNVNSVLRKEGFLKLPASADSLEGVDRNTRAFALDPARIYLNRRGRFSRGGVGREDERSILADLETLFADLTVEGRAVVRATFRREQAYSGPLSERGPDLLLVPHRGFDLKARLGADEISSRPRLQGMHTWDDAFFCSPRELAPAGSGGLDLVKASRAIMEAVEVV